MKRVRLQQVRLSEIPFEKRMIAARVATRDAVDDVERSEILLAALFPSSKLYWVKAEPLRDAA